MKKISITNLKKYAWTAFADYIKARDNYICCTCGRKGKGLTMNAGHFYPKSLGNVFLFREDNVHAQCSYCNNNSGMPAEYYQFMLKKYGLEKIEELKKLKSTQKKFTEKELIDIRAAYKQKLKEL